MMLETQYIFTNLSEETSVKNRFIENIFTKKVYSKLPAGTSIAWVDSLVCHFEIASSLLKRVSNWEQRGSGTSFSCFLNVARRVSDAVLNKVSFISCTYATKGKKDVMCRGS